MAAENQHHAPHHTPASWGEVVDSIDAANVFVVISGWLGPQARAELSVEDIWQETLWMAWRDRHQHTWVNLSRYRSWLLGIAKNRIHDMVRAMARKKRGGSLRTARFSDLGGSDTVNGILPPRSTTPSRIASNMERARTLERALTALEPDLSDMVRLRLFEELSTDEAAQQLGIPLSTAKHRLVRGMQTYRQELEQMLGDGNASEQS
jgi:RNA polymerase sigma factor (sigma-70 family)